MTKITHHLIHIILLCLTASIAVTAAAKSKPGCQEHCGSVLIPYPFGIGSNCSANETFSITCNTSISKPFLTSFNLEVLEILLENKTMRLNSPVTKLGCNSAGGPLSPPADFRNTPFSYSTTYNKFTSIGCNSTAELFDLSTRSSKVIAGCVPLCSTSDKRNESTGCYGINCCQTEIPYISVKMVSVSLANTTDSNDCRFGFIVEKEWFGSLISPYMVQEMEYVPVVMDWDTDERCYSSKIFENVNYAAFYSSSSEKWNGIGCYCPKGYEGNAYFVDGCQDINECEVPNTVCVDRKCHNHPGWFSCGPLSVPGGNGNLLFVVVGISSGLGVLFLIFGSWALWKLIKRRKKSNLRRKFFKKNGGLLFQQHLSSSKQGNYVEKTKLFTSKELDIATDRYNKNRILGRGSQGTVYKGMLTDGKIVAIKMSTVIDEGRIEEFINEVVILSQINHRNVVKLHGCCLETEVPLLVYEFIPNGNLLEYIQDQQNEEFPLTWNVRLRIASEVAGALAYLHSAASVPIYHRDIKSSNILLDEKYKAKVADFGTSKTLQADQTHMTTRVQGTFGYLDPEYFRSSRYTDKSDVYSFGVVLLELLTGKRAIIQTEERHGLAAYFISSMEEGRLFDIIDDQVVKESSKREEISAMANLARRCLSLNGKKRPTMKEVAMELEAIRTSTEFTQLPSPVTEEHYEEDEYITSDIPNQWDTTTFSIISDFEEKPLMFN